MHAPHVLEQVLVAGFGALMTVAGLAGVVFPATFRELASRFEAPLWAPLAGWSRVVLGTALALASRSCPRPGIVAGVGLLLVGVGVGLLLAGPGRYQALLRWWGAQPMIALRGWGTLAACIGALLVYGATEPGFT